MTFLSPLAGPRAILLIQDWSKLVLQVTGSGVDLPPRSLSRRIAETLDGSLETVSGDFTERQREAYRAITETDQVRRVAATLVWGLERDRMFRRFYNDLFSVEPDRNNPTYVVETTVRAMAILELDTLKTAPTQVQRFDPVATFGAIMTAEERAFQSYYGDSPFTLMITPRQAVEAGLRLVLQRHLTEQDPRGVASVQRVITFLTNT